MTAVNTLVSEDGKMSEHDSVYIRADLCDGIICNTEYTELNESFDLVHEAHSNLQSEGCSDGLCPINWKPQRPSAA